MAKFKVAILGYYYEHLNNEKRELAALGDYELVDSRPRLTTVEEVLAAAADADAIITQGSLINDEVIAGLEKCKIIVGYGVGYNGMPLEAAGKKGIYICNVPDYGFEEVSDHAVALALACIKKLRLYADVVERGDWGLAYKPGVPIHRFSESRIGLVGFGRIAQAAAEKFKGLKFNVGAYDPFVPAQVMLDKGITPLTLDELIETSDCISIHSPLTDSTRNLFGREEFARMKDGVIIVNTARGPIIDHDALLEALDSGKVSSAGLDTTVPEPLPTDSPLLRRNNVIVTNHIAWYTEEARDSLQSKVAQEVVRVLTGNPPLNCVNKQFLA